MESRGFFSPQLNTDTFKYIWTRVIITTKEMDEIESFGALWITISSDEYESRKATLGVSCYMKYAR